MGEGSDEEAWLPRPGGGLSCWRWAWLWMLLPHADRTVPAERGLRTATSHECKLGAHKCVRRGQAGSHAGLTHLPVLLGWAWADGAAAASCSLCRLALLLVLWCWWLWLGVAMACRQTDRGGR